MNGAESLVRTLVDAGVEVCFANPGTSEMHFVAALDQVNGIRCILGLFEGVVTGAADGYARMAEKPAVTLLHLGPGLGNGIANLHNAKKAGTAIVNIVGEHASWHIEHDAPLTADIEGLAWPVSHWVRTAASSQSLAADGATAVAAASAWPGHIATLIVPANTAWEAADDPASLPSITGPADVSTTRIEQIAEALQNGVTTCLVLGGHCLDAAALEYASRIAQKTGATLLAETFKARFARGAGRVAITPIPYPVDQATDLLKGFKQVITVGAKPPIAFFAYPDTPSQLYAPDATLHALARPDENGLQALIDLTQKLDAGQLEPALQARQPNISLDNAPLEAEAVFKVLANELPENAIIVDESITAGRDSQLITQGAAAHDWLQICGGSIGDGLPVATGAAIACPDRRVIALEGDGSGMYCLQALWTQAREKLDVTNIIFANGSYAILKHELKNVQAQSGPVALSMMELNRPALDWVALAQGMGVDAIKATTVEEFSAALIASLSTPGPFLIEAVISTE